MQIINLKILGVTPCLQESYTQTLDLQGFPFTPQLQPVRRQCFRGNIGSVERSGKVLVKKSMEFS